MSTLGKAIILFGADTALFRSDVGRAVSIFQSGVGQMQRSLGGFNSGLIGAASVGGMVLFARRILDQADELNKLSDKTGRQVEELSALKFAYELGGGAQEGYTKGLREFNKALVEASNNSSKAGRLFKALGVDTRAKPEEAFRQFADQFSKVPEELRASVAGEILGKAGEGWIPVLKNGSRGLDEMREKAERLGIVISSDFARQSEQFNDNLKILEKGATSFGTSILKNALPALGDMAQRMADAAENGHKLKTAWDILMQTEKGMRVGTGDPVLERQLQRENPNEAYVAAMFQGRFNSGKIKGAEESLGGSALFKPGVNAEAVRKALAESEALTKRQSNAIAQMEERKRSLFDLNEQELMQIRVTTGSYAEFDAGTKKRLMGLASEIDLRKQLVEQMDAEQERVNVINERREAGDEITRDFAMHGRANLEQMQFEIGLIGRTAREQEKLQALRAIDLELQEQLRAVARAYGEDAAGALKEQTRLEAEAVRQRAAALEQLEAKQRRERDAYIGARAALRDYAEEAGNAGAQVGQSIKGGFQVAEDAGAEFLRTGKLTWSTLGDYAIDQINRIIIRMLVLKPLADSMGSGSIGDFGKQILGAFGANPNATGGGAYGNFGGADLGGVGAAPYALGGRPTPGEIALVGEKGPELWVPDGAGTVIPNSALRGGMGGTRVFMPITITTPDPGSFRASSGQMMADLAVAVRGMGG